VWLEKCTQERAGLRPLFFFFFLSCGCVAGDVDVCGDDLSELRGGRSS